MLLNKITKKYSYNDFEIILIILPSNYRQKRNPQNYKQENWFYFCWVTRHDEFFKNRGNLNKQKSNKKQDNYIFNKVRWPIRMISNVFRKIKLTCDVTNWTVCLPFFHWLAMLYEEPVVHDSLCNLLLIHHHSDSAFS